MRLSHLRCFNKSLLKLLNPLLVHSIRIPTQVDKNVRYTYYSIHAILYYTYYTIHTIVYML